MSNSLPSTTQQQVPYAKPQGTETAPVAADDFHRLVLASAGLDPHVVGCDLRKAYDKMVSLLEAEKVQYFSYQGDVTDSRVDADTALQLRAAGELAGIVDRWFGKDSAEAKNADTQVVINVQGWFDE